jgi:hypothetical protein
MSEGDLLTTTVRRASFEPKTLFYIFLKSNGPVLIHNVDKGKTVDYNYYVGNCLNPFVNEI